jgi:8-oxo-dGTP pyrophosphatase MutT (NUDIX family)
MNGKRSEIARLIDRAGIIGFDNGVLTSPAPETEHEYAAILIKKQALFGPVYFLNVRPGGKRHDRDRVYANRIALFGGKRKRKENELEEKAARREMEEETGVAIRGALDNRLFNVFGRDDQGNANHGHIYLEEYQWWDSSISSRKIRRHIKTEEKKGNIIGKLIKIKRWYPRFYVTGLFLPVDWTRCTPETVAALIADLDLDRAKRPGYRPASIRD